MDNQDKNILGAIAAIVGVAGTVAVEIEIPVAAPGILGAIGFTNAATVAIPVAAIVGVVGVVGFVAYKGYKHFNGTDDDDTQRFPGS
ncbi:hypothetical protein [Tolypothrix sp. VBCCA 56010]|uniref:hypothetical protein n=1 Tax=Tolypothrix sp. VBCCA 56010 TaxID=3137731 RepID=UPI003D7ED86B